MSTENIVLTKGYIPIYRQRNGKFISILHFQCHRDHFFSTTIYDQIYEEQTRPDKFHFSILSRESPKPDLVALHRWSFCLYWALEEVLAEDVLGAFINGKLECASVILCEFLNGSILAERRFSQVWRICFIFPVSGLALCWQQQRPKKS